ncbi:hypothetical protein EVAR_89353_1 [Eumeta japonica]|uniref:Uncharacterized protein n=1 Tax=Eumeta variegata TaxID=151549 RepID=A0A4C1Y5L6_EUMVA|nr:hypothetical protein EVAR_89353_1 [Eumeta japonica]
MPKTRSKTAQRSSNGDTDQQQSSEGTTTEASSATTTTTTATTTTEGNTDRTTTTDTSTENRAKHHKHIRRAGSGRTNRLCGRPTTVQLAAARLAALETEETDSEEDENTVVQDQETQKRVGNWVDTQMETLATIDAPHQKNGTTGQKQQNTDELATAAKIDTPPAVCATSTRPASETEQKKQTEIPTAVHATETSPTQHSRPEHIAPLQSTGNMITELATALTRRAGAQQCVRLTNVLWRTSRMAHVQSILRRHTHVVHRTRKHVKVEKSLRGKAKDAVRNLLNYSKNSETVMNALEKRFGRPDAIAIAEIQNLRTLQRPTDSPNSICEFAGDFTNIISSLRKLKKEYYLYNPEIIKCTLDKFTSAMKYRWFDFSAEQPQEEPDLIKMARF